jgi:hypothetical protein
VQSNTGLDNLGHLIFFDINGDLLVRPRDYVSPQVFRRKDLHEGLNCPFIKGAGWLHGWLYHHLIISYPSQYFELLQRASRQICHSHQLIPRPSDPAEGSALHKMLQTVGNLIQVENRHFVEFPSLTPIFPQGRREFERDLVPTMCGLDGNGLGVLQILKLRCKIACHHGLESILSGVHDLALEPRDDPPLLWLELLEFPDRVRSLAL